MKSVKEIGKIAGVSPATVSRVINGSGTVSAEKRKRVLNAVEQLNGNQPTSRPKVRTSNIGVLLPPEPVNDIHGIFLKLCALASEVPQRWSLVLLPPDTLPLEIEARHLRGELAGLMLIGHAANSHELAETLKHIPHIWLNSHQESDTNQTTLMGNEFAGRIAARYLISKKCKSCAVLSAPSSNPGFPGRVSGFQFELFSNGISCNRVELKLPQEHSTLETIFDQTLEETLESALPAILNGGFDGIFSPEERMTALLCRVFTRTGVAKTPRLVSCNHTPDYLAGIYPRPTSIDLGPRMLAELAMKELLRRISGEAPRSDQVAVIVTPQLIPGD